MQRQDVEVPDRVDPGATAQWSRQIGLAVADANARRVRLQQIDAALATPPARSLRAQLQAAAATLAAAQAAADAAAARAQAADAALLTATRGPFADAKNALAAATQAVADELSRLMAAATSSSAVTATIDGVGLRDRYRAGTATDPPEWNTSTVPFRALPTDEPFDPEIRLPAVDADGDYPRLLAALADLDDTVDAVADVVAAESVHHLVAGNLVRSAAALEIAASGTVTDEPDVIATPAPGYDVTHRVLVLMDPTAAPAWQAADPGLVATADPRYAGWLSGLLPDPGSVDVGAAALADDGTVVSRTALTADVLGLDAPGWLRVSADVGELTSRVALAARTRLTATDGSPWTGRIVLDPAETSTGRLPLTAMTAACSRLRAVLATARALSPRDLAGPDADTTLLPDGAADHAVAAVGRIQVALSTLDASLAAVDTSSSTDEMVGVLLAACDAGLTEAAPPEASGTSDRATLLALAEASRARLSSRLGIPPFEAVPGDAAATLAAARDLLARLCSAPVLLLEPVTVPVDAALRADLSGTGDGLVGATAATVRTWLADHARVRTALAALLDSHDAADALGARTRLRPRATHLPRRADARWAGADPAPAPGLVHVVALDHGLPDGPLPDRLAGLAVDTWVQTVPAATHDTAVAFHYDAPRSDPPQAVLVAVAADLAPDRDAATWALGDLVGTITSTMALARQRATAADLVDEARVRIGTLP